MYDDLLWTEYVCMDVYVWTVYGFGIWLSVFLFYFILQGEELLSAAWNGHKAAVERLLNENPSLISFQAPVSREESSYTTTYICIVFCLYICSYYYTTCIYPFTRQPDRRDPSLSLTPIHTLYSYSLSTHVSMEGCGRMVPCMYRCIVCSCTSIKS